jgi:hypothetical protein
VLAVLAHLLHLHLLLLLLLHLLLPVQGLPEPLLVIGIVVRPAAVGQGKLL